VTPAFSHRIEVRFRDCDLMGHVNNAVYFTYFEQARIVAADTLGLRRALDEVGLGLILVHGSCDYKTQVKFGDIVDVRISVVAIGRSSFTLKYVVCRVKDDEVAALGKSIQVVFDYDTGKTKPIPDGLRDKLDALVTGSSFSS